MTKEQRLKILITNDDGIKAKGISLLVSLLREANFADLNTPKEETRVSCLYDLGQQAVILSERKR